MTDNTEQMKLVVDAASIGTVIGALAGLLPSIAAVFTIAWTAIRIYETETVQSILRKRRKPKQSKGSEL
jgi:hypothetical protein